MKLSAKNMKRIQSEVIPEITKHHARFGKPVALNELPLWKKLRKSDKIKIGRYFKKMVQAGEVDGIKFAGIRNDNHSTYTPAGAGGGLGNFFRNLFN